ncbi:hypothetical protein DPX39_060064500 [Trypanosoma brucei equiperdum]|uniref:Variant surface glycoprotein n=1 Tax=Trypanosoma brucei equiperdum TaxID=630700 RepID=A0A3L6LC62_9TRYP|nr:hypothetical protein DPX39_060076700 [Trypanosoma brucei equiperdum]RHW71980.1 hypothetical protein DPX39_060082800 [Trypanosoma brucei equiperdum]RHW72023.1 hypothetical protein DPX39_060070600 [Trypanosoma brucei equiperdum]RHW72251.1 hypothetical protein DPX39_060064500 [Trypanosoma brucei equiperdum]
MASCTYNTGGTLTGEIEQAETTYHGTEKQLFESNARGGSCLEKQLTQANNKNKEKDLSHLLCKALKATDSTTKPFSELSGSQLQAEPAVLLSIRNCDDKFSASQTKDGLSADTELKEYVKSAFGEDSVKFRTAFVDAMKSLKPPVRTEQKIDATKSVEELAGTVDAAAAAAHAEGERIKKKIEAEKKVAPTKTVYSKKEEDCKEETDKYKCNENNGCEYENGECKAKEEVKVEGTTTNKNTTGSNSILIRKIPYFLAVLLLQ